MAVLIFDTETTGRQSPQLIEAAWLRVSDLRTLAVEEEFVQRYRPEKTIELGAIAVHHILDEDLVDCPPAASFALPADTEYLVGHSIDFDWEVIGRPEVKRICTYAMSRKLWPELDSFSQSALLYHFSKDRQKTRANLKGAHSALADVKFCRIILNRILLAVRPVSWEALWEFSERARIPDTMPFGKHKGVKIADLPDDYRRWTLNNLHDMDPYLRKALEGNG
ncbi:MAG: DUF3820 family protein [Acidithiobacillus sp.]|nr:DUF3820 family protein [Acidithiobacillus sp.]